MIRINRSAKPDILVEKEADWTDEFDKHRRGEPDVPKAAATRYRHPDIKSAICRDSHNKCAYCESKVTHVYAGETDHILPLSHRPELAVSWDNLAFVCKECNQPKSSYYNPALPLVNPYVEAPDDHLVFYGPMPMHWTERGRKTIEQLKLARASLLERRVERIRSLQHLIEIWQSKSGDAVAQAALRETIELECQADKEFSATVRAYVEARTGWTV